VGRHRRCKNFAWRDDDPQYISERANDKIVFRKLARELARTPAGRQPSVVRLVRLLSLNPLWEPRLRGKSPESWKRTYNRWRRKTEKRDSVQAENSPFDPHQREPKSPPEKFYRESTVKYPPPRGNSAAAAKNERDTT